MGASYRAVGPCQEVVEEEEPCPVEASFQEVVPYLGEDPCQEEDPYLVGSYDYRWLMVDHPW